jgi:hypothetical protein
LFCLLWLGVVPVWADAGSSATVVAQDWTLAAGQEQLGDVAVVAARATTEVESRLVGSLVVIGGDAQVDGVVTGDVVVFGGTASLGATADIGGDLIVLGELREHPEAMVRGSVLRDLDSAPWLRNLPGKTTQSAPEVTPQADGAANAALRFARQIVTLLALLLVSVLVATVLPDSTRNVTQVLTGSALVSLVVGLLTIAVTLVLVPLLIVICIGIPLALMLLLALVIVALFGWAVVGHLVGQRVLLWAPARQQGDALAATVGTALITVLAAIPCVGWVLAALALSWGIGAVVLSRMGTCSEAIWPVRPTAPSGDETSSGPKGDTAKLSSRDLPDDLG